MKTDMLYSKCFFMKEDHQLKLKEYLVSKDPILYKNFNSSKRTLFLRETGDNFRAAGRYPTEQTSFSLMNLKTLSNSPNGQFISTLWRGSESRENLDSHVLDHYKELENLVRNGVTLEVEVKWNILML